MLDIDMDLGFASVASPSDFKFQNFNSFKLFLVSEYSEYLPKRMKKDLILNNRIT